MINKEISNKTVKHFKEITSEDYSRCGGKGAVLAYLYNRKFPVPEGFIIFPEAFDHSKIKDNSQDEIIHAFSKLSGNKFAIRSSASSEDSSSTSFAGEFDTVLNVISIEELIPAILKVLVSKESERVRIYTTEHQLKTENKMAVIVQIMIDGDYSGVLFTANPINGDRSILIGNYVSGSGDKLVSGEANAETFKIDSATGTYHGAPSLKKFSKDMQKIANLVIREYKFPQDIEWTIKDEKLYLLQSRPITSLITHKLETGEYNDSFGGNFLWSNANASEALPEVITPSTWSIWKKFHNDLTPFQFDDVYFAGNIAGRCYFNFSLMISLLSIFNSEDEARFLTEDLLGHIPEGVEVPRYKISKMGILKFLPKMIKYGVNLSKYVKKIPWYVETNPKISRELIEQINQTKNQKELLNLWNRKLNNHLLLSFWILRAGVKLSAEISSSLRKELIELVGVEDTNALFSNMSGDGTIRSLSPLIGLSLLNNGEISKEVFMEEYGYRGYNEFELFIDINENAMNDRMDSLELDSNLISDLLKNQKLKYEQAIQSLRNKFPNKADKLIRKLHLVSERAKIREDARSEVVRAFNVIRIFYEKAGKFTKLHTGVFFLAIDELIDVLKGDETSTIYIKERIKTYETYKSLPRYPAIISGRFDPFIWMKNTSRRTDYAGPSIQLDRDATNGIITGFAGAAGTLEGIVRRIESPMEADQLVTGEILVTTSTNIGWTVLFPKCSAIVTDVGAPLSHAAIVARELGIPAVVGCGDATMRLKTGDRIRIDGAKGEITILQ